MPKLKSRARKKATKGMHEMLDTVAVFERRTQAGYDVLSAIARMRKCQKYWAKNRLYRRLFCKFLLPAVRAHVARSNLELAS